MINVRNSTVSVLDENDMEFIETLRSLGVPRNVAALIAYLGGVQEASSREVETATGLRQPEVSIAMRTMRENGWVLERDLKREGKGRPTKVYALCVAMDSIIKHFEERKIAESARMMDSIKRLKELSASR